MIDFTEVPVDDAIDYLSDLHDLPIQLDKQALAKAGIKPKRATSTLELKNVPLAVALSAILEPNKLSFMIKRGVLTVTTLDNARAWQIKHYSAPVPGR